MASALSDEEHHALVENGSENAAPDHRGARDHLAWFFALEPATRCVFAAACSFAFVLLMSLHWFGLGVYLVALLPGVLLCRHTLDVYRQDVTQESFVQSVLAGLLFTLIVFLCELAAVFFLELLSVLSLGYSTISYVALTSLFHAFLIAAWCEEKAKAAVTHRAIRFEKADTVSSILAHSIAGATALATLENVVYLAGSTSAGNDDTAFTFAILFLRTFICVPLHICWGMSNGAGIAIDKLAPAASFHLKGSLWLRPTFVLFPSVILHGLWDFPLFMARKGGIAIVRYCEATNQIVEQCWRNDFANALHAEYLVGLYMFVACLAAIPLISILACWKRVKLLRAIEAGDFSAFERRNVQTAPPTAAPVEMTAQHAFVLPRPPPIPPPASSVSLWSRADVGNWLLSAGLDQYINIFKPVNGAILVTLTDADLLELGVSVAVHRRAVTQLVGLEAPPVVRNMIDMFGVDFDSQTTSSVASDSLAV
jgi:hypothetical protein